MKRRIVFATGNAGKMREIREILADMDLEVVSMAEIGADIAIEENGSTFEENALIKARAVGKACGEIVLADDSGLEVDYLNKEPRHLFRTVYGGRYAVFRKKRQYHPETGGSTQGETDSPVRMRDCSIFPGWGRGCYARRNRRMDRLRRKRKQRLWL